MRRTVYLPILAILLFLISSTYVGAQIIVNCPPSADAFIATAAPNTNYGANTKLILGYDNGNWIVPAIGYGRILIKYDLSAIPSGATITSAKIMMYMWAWASSPTFYDFPITCFRVNQSWSESTVTYNNRPIDFTELGSSMFTEDGFRQWYFDVTTLAQEWYIHSRINNGIMLVKGDVKTDARVGFYSKEAPQYPSPDWKYCLEVTYTLPDFRPVINSFNINNSDLSTTSRTVTLNNSCTNTPTEYEASEDVSFTGAIWQSYSSAPSFLLSSGNGTKRVYFRVRNSYGVSAVDSYDDISLNEPYPSAPIAEMSGQPTALYPGVVYAITANYYSGSSIAQDLRYCDLRLDHPTSNDLTMRWDQDNSTFYPMPGSQGADYLDLSGVEISELGGAQKGYRLTWCFTVKTNWQPTQNGIRFGLYAEDDSGLNSGWHYDNMSSSFVNNPAAMLQVPHYYQDSTGWCAPTSISMLLKYYGINKKPWQIADTLDLPPGEGVNSAGMTNYLQNTAQVEFLHGYALSQILGVPFWPGISSLDKFIRERLVLGHPVMMESDEIRHAFVVTGFDNQYVYINDPSGYCFQAIGETVDRNLYYGLVAHPVLWDDFHRKILGGHWEFLPWVMPFADHAFNVWSIDDNTLTPIVSERSGTISVYPPYSGVTSYLVGSYGNPRTKVSYLRWDGVAPHQGYYYDEMTGSRSLDPIYGARFTRDDRISLVPCVSNADIVPRDYTIEIRWLDNSHNLLKALQFNNIRVASKKSNVELPLLGASDMGEPTLAPIIESSIDGTDNNNNGLIDENIAPIYFPLAEYQNGTYFIETNLLLDNAKIDGLEYRVNIEGGTALVGALQVTLGPAGAISAGAQWNVDGGAWQDSAAVVSGLSIGSHTVNYRAVTGWTAPDSESAAISYGVTTQLSRTYTQQTGSLQVTLSPAGAISAGAQWNVDGGAWQDSAAVVSGLSIGSHTVNYRAVTGWTAPVSESATISYGVTTQVSRTYVQQTGSLQVTLSPAGAISAGAQWNVDGGAWQDSGVVVSGLLVGIHTVYYKAVTGWTAPDSESALVSNGVTTQLSRTYVLIVTPEITLTSPNGGEIWPAGSTHDIAWTQTGLTGSVTIDLYKGGAWLKTLGTPAATAGTFSWTIASTETAGTDYRVLVRQGDVSDNSNGNFTIVHVDRADFNKDGQEDILWRYYGSGEIQGWDLAWLIHQTGTLPLGILGTAQAESGIIMTLQAGLSASKSYMTPMEAGISSKSVPDLSFGTPLGLDTQQTIKPRKIMKNGMGIGRGLSRRSTAGRQEKEYKDISAQKDTEESSDPRGIATVDPGSTNVPSMKIAALDSSEMAFLPNVLDTAWEIAGTGDFNADGNTDILWRYYGSGYIQGWDVIWYMNGTTITSYGFLPTVQDTNWRIAGTGDFDGDGKLDVLWRYYGGGDIQGWNVIWHLDGETIARYGFPTAVADLDWRVDGIGDFDGDGKSDMLWRYYGGDYYQGMNVIWYMTGETLTSYGYPTAITKLGWRAEGVGDFDNDGKADILWRCYESGYHLGLNVVWYMDGAVDKSQEVLTQVHDTNWRIVSR